ncbi:MAG: methyltransferase domain-containing protein [wastewater metagenome]|nr:methyltransferase domain-containing protein [Candidatus Loosdrechtia aerotolerans]
MILQSVELVKKCPVCSSSSFSSFYTISHMPTHVGILWKDKNEALSCPRGDIELACCSDCGFISNIAFDPSMMEYTREYDNSLYFSKCYRDYTKSIAERLIKGHQLYKKRIIEIGSGKGDFLYLLCEMGNNYGVGFDPSGDENLYQQKSADRMTLVKDYFSKKYSHYYGDFICSRNVFEHVPDPLGFLKMLRAAVHGKHNTVFYFEVPNISLILKDLSVWDIIYEHCSYFGLTSLEKVFHASGFNTIKLSHGFEGQFISIEASPAKNIEKSFIQNQDTIKEFISLIKEFSYNCTMKLRWWDDTLRQIEQNNEKTVVWGAGGKSVSFLNILRSNNSIQYVVDINPRKQGCYVPGTGQRIILPEELTAYRPENVIIMNPVYQQEIRQQLDFLHLNPRVLLAL